MPLRADHGVGVPPGPHRRHHRPRRRPPLTGRARAPVLDVQLNPSAGPWTDLRDRARGRRGRRVRRAVDVRPPGRAVAARRHDVRVVHAARRARRVDDDDRARRPRRQRVQPHAGRCSASPRRRWRRSPIDPSTSGSAPAPRPTAGGRQEMRAIGQPVAATVGGPPRAGDGDARRARPAVRPAAATPSWPRSRSPAGGRRSCSASTAPALAELAGRRADGVNVGWDHPRRDELLDVARRARGDRPGFVVTTWLRWAPELLDPDHPTRRAMAARHLDRVVLTVPAAVDVVGAGDPAPGGDVGRLRR